MKPVIFAANVADSDLASGNDMSQKVFEYAAQQGAKAVLVSAQVSGFWWLLPLASLVAVCVVVLYGGLLANADLAQPVTCLQRHA
jgi:hypothetical protein